MNIDASEREIRLTWHQEPNDPVEPPDGEGWYLRGMSAESPGGDNTEGGVWLLWDRARFWAEKEAGAGG